MKKYIPNFLTISRIILVPVFIWLIYFVPGKEGIIWATAVFILASITDYFDGMLARKFKVISEFGKIMDPLADKILVLSALIALSVRLELISLITVIVILIREVIVSLFREYFASRRIFIPANIWGKIKTFMQMVGTIAALLVYTIQATTDFRILPQEYVYDVFNFYFWIIAIITWYSGFQYFFNIIGLKKK